MKSTEDKARQKIFEEIRHVVGSKHQVPEYLDVGTLMEILKKLQGRK